MGCGCKNKKKVEEAAVVESEVKTEDVKVVNETEEKKEN